MPDIPTVRLNNDVEIPQLGFGVFQIPQGDDTVTAVTTALEAGYRHIDTAQGYGNETEVGQAIRKSGLDRDEVFVTTKLDNSRHGRDEARRALDESLERLGFDHVDLFLIHWPRPAADKYVETWQGFEQILADGKARAIGVSNFQPAHLQRLAAETDTVPAVNQIELHPYLQQTELRAYHRDHGIATEAWSPLGKGRELLQDDKLGALAEKYDRTTAQVVLRWHLQVGNVVIPKSVTPERVRENIDVFGFELADDDLATIATLERELRLGPDPDTFG
ncbi:aldo/keto reductase [Pseudonocardia sp. CA-107938]|uniref:aldo/keto reductase n=1 Tax=Pseudonocardia sp. CA-107938 TaxID=3240021 RepID=UPI003D90DC89